MASLSDYLESGLLHHLFRGQSFPKPTNIAIALCSGVPVESCDGNAQYHSGGTLPELPSGDSKNNATGYARINLGDPSSAGNGKWDYSEDPADGSGIIKNASSFMFDEGEGSAALVDWGWVSGIAIVDSGEYGTGNLLMYAALQNPRIIYTGDTVKFDTSTLQISFS
tara:strand:- start:6576 stop:7076 length:501 start_codon:yes stop_codon:yes gene_type:complete